jgi:hypothetical protein
MKKVHPDVIPTIAEPLPPPFPPTPPPPIKTFVRKGQDVVFYSL